MLSLRLVVIGDTGSGKTSLIVAYTCNAGGPGQWVPDVFEEYTANVMVQGRPCQLCIRDTSAEWDVSYRTNSYSEADIILILFDLNDRNTFQSIKTKWKPEIDFYCPNVPYILVGNKHWDRKEFYEELKDVNNHNYLDIETSKILIHGFVHGNDAFIPDSLINICVMYYFTSTPVSKEEGMEMSKEIGANRYMEHEIPAQDCKLLFDEAIKEAIKYDKLHNQSKKKNCLIL